MLYTPDDGATILPVAVNLTETSVTILTDELPGGPTARFIVRANDGWNIGEDASDPALSVSNRAPIISFEASDFEFTDDLPSGLFVSAWDPEDGFLTEDQIEWTLDGQVIATGFSPVAMLAAGSGLTLKATATDSSGIAVNAQKTIEVIAAQDGDADGDGITDDADNCPETPNAGQEDEDGDGVGDACKGGIIGGSDSDGIDDEDDNCPADANPDQADADGNGIGDACEGCGACGAMEPATFALLIIGLIGTHRRRRSQSGRHDT